MKALTIWQPYASLIAKNVKHYETRGFRTHYRGPLLIHSGQRPMRWILKHSDEDALDVAIEFFGMDDLLALPVGSAICVVDLVDCIEMTPDFIRKQSPTELAVGDWKPGRYAWKLENPRELDPVELLGKQGIWNAELCVACRYNTRDFVAHPHCSGCDGVKHFEKIEQKVACVFCGAKIDKKMAHDPRPASSSGLCCGACNMEIVVPARIEAANKDKEETTQ